MTYTEKNTKYWNDEYKADNVDHAAFRVAGRILRPDFDLPSHQENHLDFGCGTGATVNYYTTLGFKSYGVDSSNTAIMIAQKKYPRLAKNFILIDPLPQNNLKKYPELPFKVVTAFQSLYYLDKNSLEITLSTLHEKMEKKGIFVATMMSILSKQFYDNSIETSDPYLREINFTDSRQEIKDYFISFIFNEEDLMNKFKMFKPVHIGYYSAKFRNDEGDGHHYVFTGIKE